MSSEQFDLVVLGSGSAARDAARKAASEHGARVALVESARWGGGCPNVACKPTKAYLVAAELVHAVNERASLLGVEAGPARADLARIKARKDELTGTQAEWIARLRGAGYETIEAPAAFLEPGTIRAGDRLLGSDRVLIATGSRTAVPPIEGLDEIDWLDHVSALELTELPESLLVLGGGAVGLEFGQIFARFGSRVTIVDALERIAARSDPDAAAELAAALTDEGIELVTSTFVGSVRRDGSGLVARLAPRGGGEGRDVRVERILLASGRVPNVEGLDLAAAGVDATKAGITVDEHLRTSAAGVWAAGDVTGIAQLTPVAQYQARIAVRDMFAPGGPGARYSELPSSIFTDPELGSVGLTPEDAAEQGLDAVSVSHELRHVQRASYTNTRHGLYKLVFERGTRRLLGVHVVAPNAGDIVQGLGVAMRLGATVDDLAAAHHAFLGSRRPRNRRVTARLAARLERGSSRGSSLEAPRRSRAGWRPSRRAARPVTRRAR